MDRRGGGSTGHVSLLRAALAGVALVLHPPVLCRGTSPAKLREDAAARVPRAASLTEYAAAIVAATRGANATALRRTPRSVEDVSRFIARELRPKLLAQSLHISGASYRFGPPDEELTVVVIRYPSSIVSAEKKRTLGPLNGFCAGAETLARFSAAQAGALLVIVSTENSGEDRMVGALHSFPDRLAEDVRLHRHRWSEEGP